MYRIANADCLEYLKGRPDEKIHAVVTDPPYGLSREPDIEEVLTKWLAGEDYEHRGSGFMGKEWDSFVPGPAVWREVYRVLKPGGHALVFAGSRTADLMTIALRLAGFEIRDELMWLYGQGFPKSHNIGKAIDRLLGHERERVPMAGGIPSGSNQLVQTDGQNPRATDKVSDEPMSEEAARWGGWGSALKPAHEPIIVARKPLGYMERTTPSGRPGRKRMNLAENVLAHGVGGYNIGGTMLVTEEDLNGGSYSPGGRGDGALNPEAGNPNGWSDATGMFAQGKGRMPGQFVQPPGRHPANVIFGHNDDCAITDGGVYLCHPACAVRLLDDTVGYRAAGSRPANNNTGIGAGFIGDTTRKGWTGREQVSTGGGAVSRFFYTPKATRKERDAGLEALVAAFGPTMGDGIGAREHNPEAPGALVKNTHPTVKPIELMRWLCRLVTPENGVILDPYMGSGTTGIAAILEGFNFVGIEQQAEYVAIAQARLEHWDPERAAFEASNEVHRAEDRAVATAIAVENLVTA